LRRRFKILHKISLVVINRNFVNISHHNRPDVIIVIGGDRITRRALKQLIKDEISTVLWTTDPPRKFQPIINSAPFYSHIVCLGTEAVDLLHNAGIKDAHWLPMACDSDYHQPLELSIEDQDRYSYDIAFVGSYYQRRAELLEGLSSFNLGIWGPGWEQLPVHSPLRALVKGAHTKPGTWRKIYSASKITLSIHYQDPEHRFPVYQASPRVFEALACGAFIITDSQRDVMSLFKDREHLVAFSDKDDLQEKVAHFLEHPQERVRIAGNGRREVLENHTYIHRLEKLLSLINAGPRSLPQSAISHSYA